jgi:DNA polymerase-3 subunit epsilon
MREIVFDTETTGFGVEEHRVLEIGALEMVNRLPTGRTFHTYLNPERAIDTGAEKIHGISLEKVQDAPRFADVVHQWLEFIGDAPLVAHNAEFDMAFMNMELGRCGLQSHSNMVIDTLTIAREKLPGQRHKLDALCSHYGIDNSARVFHGALLDAQLLAEVYVELMGGLQASFGLEPVGPSVAAGHTTTVVMTQSAGVVIAPSPEELAAHQTFLEAMVPKHTWGKEEA